MYDTKERVCLFVDVSVPVCDNVIKKEAEIIIKHRDLEIEVSTITIVVGELG